jgi:hypothetical protein
MAGSDDPLGGMLLPSVGNHMYQHILIPTDSSELSKMALHEGIALARALGAPGFAATPRLQAAQRAAALSAKSQSRSLWAAMKSTTKRLTFVVITAVDGIPLIETCTNGILHSHCGHGQHAGDERVSVGWINLRIGC